MEEYGTWIDVSGTGKKLGGGGVGGERNTLCVKYTQRVLTIQPRNILQGMKKC